jgi:hypothetical protein
MEKDLCVKRIIINGAVKHVEYHRSGSELPLLIIFKGDSFVRSGFDEDGKGLESIPAKSRISNKALDCFEQDLFEMNGGSLEKRYPNIILRDAKIDGPNCDMYKLNSRYC